MTTQTEEAKVDAWMPLWIGAYLADTMALTRDQHGGYLLLLFAYWRNKGPLLADDEDLAAIARATPAEWRKLGPRLARFFEVRDGYWFHTRADKELIAAGIRRSAAVAKAKAGAEARWGKSKGTASGNAPRDAPSMPGALPKQCPTPSPSPSIPPDGGINNDGPDSFETAWQAYPDRPGDSKATARKAWTARLKAGVSAGELLAGVERYAAFVTANRTEPQFIKQAATFFGPGEHYLNDWTPIARIQAAANQSNHDRRADFMAGLVANPGGPFDAADDERTFDVDTRIVG